MDTHIFSQVESAVRSYCRTFPVVFSKAKDAFLYTEHGERYIDFFAGAGALNYGHNNEYIKHQLMEYISSDQLTHGLDMYTTAKRHFLAMLQEHILEPRDLQYKVQFCGPTGTNAVEAALKLARKVKQRPGIFAFMGGYHGMSLGSLSVTGSTFHRAGAGVPLSHVTFMPYPYGFMNSFDTITYIETVLNDPNSGVEKPAAIICETIQAEGGVVIAPVDWLSRLNALCRQHDILFICDDIQVGCGRTGPFFSFERASIVPDIVILSKSISGYGLPCSILLYKPELDIWQPGEHNGTFRGNQLAFICGAASFEYWKQNNLEQAVKRKGSVIRAFLDTEVQPLSDCIQIRGEGMIWGIDFTAFPNANVAQDVIRACFRSGLIIECAGRNDQVVKILPPLTIDDAVLEEGCQILRGAIADALQSRTQATNEFVA